MKRVSAIVLALGLVSATAMSCSRSDKPTTIEVSARLSICVAANDCHGVAVPNAEVVVSTPDGRVLTTGRTQDDGIAHLTVTEAGQTTVLVKTPLWKEKEKSAPLMVVAGSDHDLTVWGSLAETVVR